jgi:hypothetical protein
LIFQAVIVIFLGCVVLALAGAVPGWLGTGPAALRGGLRAGFMLTVPLAVVGVVLGVVGSMQIRRRKLLAVLGTLLNALQVLLGLLVLSWM